MQEEITMPVEEPVLSENEVSKPASDEFLIEKGTEKDLDTLEKLYTSLNDYLTLHTNYPGWIKDVYPVRETAEAAIREGTLYVCKTGNKIAGSVILNHEPEAAYSKVLWSLNIPYKEITVIHTLAVHPDFMRIGVGKRLMDFALDYCREQKIKSVRLDVSNHNTPAICLYEKCGFRYVGTVDLGLNIPDLKWFRLYELIL